jgi:undecaprenyl diphosphate synthase
LSESIAKRREPGGAPAHLAIIPDGNRRWSREHRMNLLRSYNSGIRKFIDVSIWAKQFGVQMISVWALSTENIKSRSASELATLYGLYAKASQDPHILRTLEENGAHVSVVGDTSMLPKRLKAALKSLERKTKSYGKFSINILVGYGGREDIMHAVKKIMGKKGSRLTYKAIKENLRSSLLPDVDMIIRTSGEMRLSGFLPWQSGYSELYFSQKYWPSFEKADLRRAIVSFADRNRRFGR